MDMKYLRRPLLQVAAVLLVLQLLAGWLFASLLEAGAVEALKNRRDAVVQTVERLRAVELAGRLPSTAARERARDVLAGLQDAGSGYLWVVDASGQVLLDTRTPPAGDGPALAPLPELKRGATVEPRRRAAQGGAELLLQADFAPWEWRIGLVQDLAPTELRVRQAWMLTIFLGLLAFAVLVGSFALPVTSSGRQLDLLLGALEGLLRAPRAQRPETLELPDAAVDRLVELRDLLLDGRQQAEAAALDRQRLLRGLDQASVNLMLIDVDGILVYANDTVRELLRQVEAELRIRIPDFSVDRLEGRHFREFHPESPHIVQMVARLTAPHCADVRIGSHLFRLVVTPLTDAEGQRLGTLLEWHERTAEVAVGEAMSALLHAAAQGDFSHRLEAEHQQGSMGLLAGGINELVAVVAGSLEQLENVIHRLSRGDLSGSMGGSGGGSFARLREDTNRTLQQLRAMVASIDDIAHAVSEAAGEIAVGNADLSRRSEEQATALLQAASAMEQIGGAVRRNADNAGMAQSLALRSNELAGRGAELMQRVEQGMQAMRALARRINDIVGVIDSIAFQTNILALNAAVEAARAGEQGRGFAVVAAEVRALSQRCTQSAREIKTLVASSVGEVEQGGRRVDEAGQVMGEIVTTFHQLSDLVSDIALASGEQSHGIAQVRATVARAEELTQHNAALVEQVAATAENLDEKAHGLLAAVGVFRLDEGEAAQGREST